MSGVLSWVRRDLVFLFPVLTHPLKALISYGTAEAVPYVELFHVLLRGSSVSAWSATTASPAQVLFAVQGAAGPAQKGSDAGRPSGRHAAEQR